MKTKHLFIPFVFSIIATIICRVFQILNPINVQIFEIICFFIALTSLVISSIMLRTTKNITSNLQIKKSLIVTVFSMIASLLIIIDSFVRLINYITLYRDIMQLSIGIFGILSGITFVIIAISFYKGENHFNSKKIITLFPCVWGILRLLELFFIYNIVSNNPWEMSDNISMMILLAFFLNLARGFAEIKNDKKIKRLLLWGFSFSAFVFIYSSNKLLAYTKTYANFEFDSFITYLTDLILGIFVIVFLINIKTNKTESDESENMQEELDNNEANQNEIDSDIANQNNLEESSENESETKNLDEHNSFHNKADSIDNENTNEEESEIN